MIQQNISANYDVVVVGGGIHGVGVAQASAAQGYSVLLLEQNEIGSGTSRKSSKLIHGGLRYLETAQFSLVRECLAERHYLLNNAPHLVEMKPFYLPVYQQTSRRPAQLQLGLLLYTMLAGFRKQTFFQRVKTKNWGQLDGLSTENLQTVFQYWDAQTDDQLLTKAVLNSAKDLGAEAIEQSELLSANYVDKEWQIILQQTINEELNQPQGQAQVLKEAQNKAQKEVRAKIIVNAGGPWVNDVLKRITPNDQGMAVDLVQGTHIVLPQKTEQGIYYVESPEDKRAIFVMPWYGETLVGTTEKMYSGDPAKVRPSEEEESYLLATVRHYFPKFEQAEIKRSFAGLRVLPRQQEASFSRPRETTIYTDKTNTCLSIYGGKLTAYRATSAKVVDQFKVQLPPRKSRVDTRTLKLPG